MAAFDALYHAYRFATEWWAWGLGALLLILVAWFVLWLRPWHDDHHDENESGD